ncbi:farnesyl-diphosphate synthase [Cytidiella melzeri]|nr:farnesyl-diphosphate synthase [Cytidiella melzeri]
MSDAKALKRTKFQDVFNVIRDEVLEYVKAQNVPQDALEWFHKSLDHNVPGGKLNRGLSVVDSVEILKGRALTDEEYFKAAVLGWCVELLQAFFLVSDDLMDSSITRRGQPCWYRKEGVNLIAVNDSFMLEACIYYLLKKHFRQDPSYVNLLELFLETTFQTEIGQLLDLITAPEDSVDLSKFSLEKHRLIVVYKTAFYSFYLPVALAMYYCNIPHEQVDGSQDPYKLAQSILIPLGEYFQIQDDFLDFAGTPEQIGKIGTDIIDNKCSWCINTALAAASPEQRAVLDSNYGLKNAESEKKVKDVFYAVGVPEKYYKYEEDAYKRIMGLIQTIPEGGLGTDGQVKLQRQVFKSFLDKIYKRQK